MKPGTRHKLLVGTAALVAVASGTIAAGLWDDMDVSDLLRHSPRSVAVQPDHPVRAEATAEEQARMLQLQGHGKTFGDLWRASSR
ncbi:MAG TPA: hypothetical protein VLK85_02935 [Ramlibacter sp.]|nr:hypothetical protein [Ramlibacter sp.]